MGKRPERGSRDARRDAASSGAATPETGPSGWTREDGEGTTLSLRAKPRASRSQILGVRSTGDALEVALAAPPVDGEANAELLSTLASALGVPRSQLRLVSGETGKDKRVKVAGLSAREVTERLLAAAGKRPQRLAEVGEKP